MLAVLVATAVTLMAVLIRRGVMSVVRTTADQIGLQNESEQIGTNNALADDDSGGYLIDSYAISRVQTRKTLREQPGGNTTYLHDDRTSTLSNTLINLGYTNILE